MIRFQAELQRLKLHGPGDLLKPGAIMERKFLDQPVCLDPRVINMIRDQLGGLADQVDG